MAIQKAWHDAFTKKREGSGATQDRAFKTWSALRKFSDSKKWDLAPATITPKQMRQFLEYRATVVCARSVQNEASHLRRAIKGAGQVVEDVRDKTNKWSSSRLKVPAGSRIGGKAAADLSKWALARPKMDKDIQAVIGLIEAIGLRCKEGVMASGSLKEWERELAKPESAARGCAVHVVTGTKGGRPRFVFIPAGRVGAVQTAVLTARAVEASHKGRLIDPPDLKLALKRYTNCMSRLGLTGTDSGHGLRRAWAQQQYVYYRETGLIEKEALRRLSNDLGHGDGRGRWVWNNYLLGGSA